MTYITPVGDFPPMYCPHPTPFPGQPLPGYPGQPFYAPPPMPEFPPHGCICPPTSEATCRGDFCPRRPIRSEASAKLGFPFVVVDNTPVPA